MTKGQIFTGVFLITLIGTLLLITVVTIGTIIYFQQKPDTVTIIYVNETIANATVDLLNESEEYPNVIRNNLTYINDTIDANVSNINLINLTNLTNMTNTSINITISIPEHAELVNGSCHWRLPYQDFNCSPGQVMTTNTTLICTPGYATRVRNVSQNTKDKVYALYGVVNHTVGQWEIDHIVPLSLGGSNNVSNLYPQPAAPYPGFHAKDRVEAYFYTEVCNGRMALSTAQMEIVNNWVPYIDTAMKTNIPSDNSDVQVGDQIIG